MSISISIIRLTAVFLAFICTGLLSTLNGQDNQIEEDAFANFLFSSHHYDFAAEEYQRLLYYDSDNLEYLDKLITCYQHTDVDYFKTTHKQFLLNNNKQLIASYMDMLISTQNVSYIEEVISTKKKLFTEKEISSYQFKLAVAKRDWSQALKIYPKVSTAPENYKAVLSSIGNRRSKKPIKAALMSAIVPGTGRFYAQDYKDGIISILFIGSAAFQSYRRFDQRGSGSVAGWIFGGIALGFYVSNIYGSYQSAKYYNKKLDDKLYQYAMPIIMHTSQQ